jgi:Cu/Ag efflux protein CusF
VGSGSTAAATVFKVQDGLLFNAVKLGDKVTFTAENVDGVMTIEKLTRE